MNPDHLFLGTHLDNTADKMAKGRFKPMYREANGMWQNSASAKHGMDSPHAKLTDDIVREILVRVEAGETHRSIASSYGVVRSAVTKVVAGETWSHVTGRTVAVRLDKHSKEGAADA